VQRRRSESISLIRIVIRERWLRDGWLGLMFLRCQDFLLLIVHGFRSQVGVALQVSENKWLITSHAV
jgi:hypothetical protein